MGSKKKQSEEKIGEIQYERYMTEMEKIFFSSLGAKELRALKCKGCRKVVFPPPDFCPFCGTRAKKSDLIKISNNAKVISQTSVHYFSPLVPEFRPPFSIIAINLNQTHTIMLVPSRDSEIYLGDRVKVFVKSKDRKSDASDIELEKL